MTTVSQSTKRKLSLLQLAEELRNVSKAWQIMGYHRDTFYEVQKAFKVGGVSALVEERRGPKNPQPNRVPETVEQVILDLCLAKPTYGSQRIANELRLQGVDVSPPGYAAPGCAMTWRPATSATRLLRLEAEAREQTHVLTDEQIRLLERHSPEFRMRHVEASAPGELLNLDTFYWGTLKGVGKIYVQVVVDAFCRWRSPRSTPRRCRSQPPTCSTTGCCRFTNPSVHPCRRYSPTTAGSSVASPSSTPTSCCWRCSTSTSA